MNTSNTSGEKPATKKVSWIRIDPHLSWFNNWIDGKSVIVGAGIISIDFRLFNPFSSFLKLSILSIFFLFEVSARSFDFFLKKKLFQIQLIKIKLKKNKMKIKVSVKVENKTDIWNDYNKWQLNGKT